MHDLGVVKKDIVVENSWHEVPDQEIGTAILVANDFRDAMPKMAKAGDMKEWSAPFLQIFSSLYHIRGP